MNLQLQYRNLIFEIWHYQTAKFKSLQFSKKKNFRKTCSKQQAVAVVSATT